MTYRDIDLDPNFRAEVGTVALAMTRCLRVRPGLRWERTPRRRPRRHGSAVNSREGSFAGRD